MKKKILIFIILVIFIIISFAFLYLFNFIPHRKYTNKDFGIEDYISKTDKDRDGIDDQTDILENVRKYIATKPKYKSKYYNTGYPNDEYGVCTSDFEQQLKECLFEVESEDDTELRLKFKNI